MGSPWEEPLKTRTSKSCHERGTSTDSYAYGWRETPAVERERFRAIRAEPSAKEKLMPWGSVATLNIFQGPYSPSRWFPRFSRLPYAFVPARTPRPAGFPPRSPSRSRSAPGRHAVPYGSWEAHGKSLLKLERLNHATNAERQRIRTRTGRDRRPPSSASDFARFAPNRRPRKS